MALDRDGNGFLKNRDEWSVDVMRQMAEEDGFNLTEEVEMYIHKAREMYEADGTVPAVRVFAKQFGMDRKAKPLYEAFKSGPMKIIAKYAGLPQPTGCV